MLGEKYKSANDSGNFHEKIFAAFDKGLFPAQTTLRLLCPHPGSCSGFVTSAFGAGM